MSMSKNNNLMKHINSTLMDLPSPSNMNYLWNFGSLLGLCLAIQIMTGMFLAMHYSGDMILAFKSIIHMSSDVNYGFLLKSIHANGASLFFLCVYIHIGKGLYYGSYQKKFMWFSGVIMFMMMMLTAFMGYVLPWGQMSFWAATVITNFLSAIPYIGNDMVQWMWGGFSVNNATLGSFYSLHYLFPFILASLMLIHMMLLHSVGSSNPLGISSSFDKVPFHWYFVMKDIYGFFMIMFMLLLMVFFFSNLLGDSENFMNANSLVTPIHMMPEWYFLFAYAMLSSIPNKLGGVLALVLSMVVLFIIPFLHTNNFFSLTFSPMGKFLYWMFMANFILLTWLGSKPIESPYVIMSMMSSLFYFLYFLMMIPVMGKFENFLFFSKLSV